MLSFGEVSLSPNGPKCGDYNHVALWPISLLYILYIYIYNYILYIILYYII